MMKKIMICTDGSLYAPSVYQHAAWAAKNEEASVVCLHVIEREEFPEPNDYSGSIGFDASQELLAELVEHEASMARVARRRGDAILEDAQQKLGSELSPDRIETRLEIGSLVDNLSDWEGETDLIVLGKRGTHADFSHGHLGSNLERVVRRINKPVLVASRAFSEPKRFLLAFDGGKSGHKAVDHLAASKLLKGLHCQILSVGEPGSRLESQLADAQQKLAQHGYEVSSELISGDPDDEIARYVQEKEVDLLVMGAYGHSRIREFILGSTTTTLVRTCQIPVLLFR